MRRANVALGAVSALLVLALSLPSAVVAGPGLTLNPSSGDPPTATGSLGGSGWLCGSGAAPAGGAAVSGAGVAGSATINRDGSLSGSFTVRGRAGQRVEVKVTANASCPSTGPAINLQASAYFTFNAATATPIPRPSSTHTQAPTATAPPTSTRIPATPTRPTSTPEPTATQQPTSIPDPTSTSEPAPTPRPTSTQEPTPARVITFTPEPATPEPAAEPSPTAEVEPAPTETPGPAAVATVIPAVMPSPTEPRAAVVLATPTATVTSTLVATPDRAGPTLSATATPPADPVNGRGRLSFMGCVPQASQIEVEFLPLGMLATGGAESSAPSGPGLRVSATAAKDSSGVLAFQPPSTAEAGRVYRVSAIVNDPQCPSDTGSAPQYWLAGAGKDVRLPFVAPGESRLEVSNNGDKQPIPLAVVKGAFMESGRPAEYAGAGIDPPSQFDGWETDIQFYGSLEGHKQRFRWSTDLASAGSALLQVGMLPFPKGYESDPLSPPGILASWPVDCVSCEFVVDLSPLPAPEPKASPVASAQASESLLEKVGQLISTGFNAIGRFFGDVAKAVAGLFGGSKEPAVQPDLKQGQSELKQGQSELKQGQSELKQIQPDLKQIQPGLKTVEIEVPSSKVTLAEQKLGGNSVAKPIKSLVFTSFYFRVLPLKGGSPAGSGSNAVVMHWEGDSAPKVVVPDLAVKPTATPTPSAYETEIVSYHGVIPPIGQCTYGKGLYNSYVVLQDAWWDKSKPGFQLTTAPIGGSAPYVKKGDVLCEPPPKEPDLLEKIGKWVSGAWNWIAEAYSDLKGTVISAVGFFIPDSLCSDSCVGVLLDAALVSMGIPPDIPNLDQLMSEGLDYIAQQTVAQIGLPPEVLEQTGPYAGMLLSEAEAKFKEEAQAKLKEGLQKGVKQIQLGYADSVGWLPKGVPVRPNEYQPPGMSIKVSRKYGVPGGEAGCTAKVYDSLTIDQSKLDNVPPGYVNGFKDLDEKQAFVPGKTYDLFVDLALPVPPLAPGSSVTIPMSFKPNVYSSGWNPWGSVQTTDYFAAWGYLQMLGDVQLSVYGCGSAKLDVAASGTYGAAQQ